MMLHPHAVLGLADGGAHCGLICDASMPTFLLTHWARDRSAASASRSSRWCGADARTAAFYGLATAACSRPA